MRIFVTNKLPEHTSVTLAWPALTQWYGWGQWADSARYCAWQKLMCMSFVARCPAPLWTTRMPMKWLEMAMGMMGFWVMHIRNYLPELITEVDRDFWILLNSYDIEPGRFTPNVSTMTEFNSLDHEQSGLSGDRSLTWCVSMTRCGSGR